MVVFVILARLLSPDDFGLLALATVFTAFLGIFRDQGLGLALIQKENLDDGDLDTGFWAITGSGMLLTAVAVLASGSVATIMEEPRLAPIIQWLSIGLTLTALGGTHDAILRRKLDFRSVTVRSLSGTIAGGAIGVGMALKGFGVWSLVGQSLTDSAVRTGTLWSLTRWRPRARFNWKSFLKLYRFGLNIIGTNITSFLNKRSDDFFIGIHLDSTALGYYSVGYKIIERTKSLIGSALNQAAFATFSRLQSDPEKFRSAYYKAAQISAVIAMPIFLVSIVVAPEIIEGVFGTKWLEATPVFQLLAAAAITQVLEHLNLSVLLAVGRPDLKLKLTVAYAVLNVIVFVVFARFGIVYVALAFLIRCYATMPLSYWLTRKIVGFSMVKYLRFIRIPVIASIATAVIVWFAKAAFSEASVWTLLGVTSAGGIACYTVAIRFGDPQLFRRTIQYFQLFVQNAGR